MSDEQLTDVQGGNDDRNIALAKAGVCDLRLPVPFTDADDVVYPVECTAKVWAAVAARARGTHMSRQVAAARRWRDGLRLAELPAWVAMLAKELDSAHAGCELDFAMFIERVAPVTKQRSWLDITVKIIASGSQHDCRLQAKVTVPVTMLCPCSKEISARGAHSQRGELSIALERQDADLPCLREIALRVEKHSSSQLYALLKRPDEKVVTEKAYDNPRFAEDAVRSLAEEMRNLYPNEKWDVGVVNFESIHNHNVFVHTDSTSPGTS